MIKLFEKIIMVILCIDVVFIQSYHHQKPLLVVILMVKNEEPFMEKTLLPFLNAGIDHYLILDTGSTDNTIQTTKQLFQNHNIEHGYTIEQPFINFAASRNYALECAEQLFTNAHFFLMLDAEWYMQNVDQLLDFCVQNHAADIDAFAIKITTHHYEYYVRRLFNASKKIRFINDIHEYAHTSSCKNLPDNIFIQWDNSAQGYNKSRQRWVHDKELLLQKNHQEPNDLRTLFYLGQTCANLHEFDQAISWYTQRFEQNGNSEEKLLAGYRLGIIYEDLQNWSQALHYYLEAYKLNPLRAESLIHIAFHYLKHYDYQKSFLFAQQSCDIPYPQANQYLIIEPYVYNYTRYAILAISAWYIQEYEIGKYALQQGLYYYPQDKLLLDIKTKYEQQNL